MVWSFLGVTWQDQLYFDMAAVMGCRLAPYIMKRVTNMIRHIMANLEHVIFNYVDNFMGIDVLDKAIRFFNTLGHLLRDLGVNEAADKMVFPCQLIVFLGILFHLLRMIILLPDIK